MKLPRPAARPLLPTGIGAPPLAVVLWATWTCLAVALTCGLSPLWLDSLRGLSLPTGMPMPFSAAGLARALGGHAAAVAELAVALAAALGMGTPPAAFLGLRLPGLAGTGIRLALGWGVIALANQGLGLAGLYHPAVLAAEALLAVGAGLARVRRERPWTGDDRPARGDGLAVALTLVMLGAYVLLARMADTHEDARVYHLAAPEAYLLAHRIYAEPYHLTWHMPLGAEMLFVLPYRFGGLAAAKLVNLAALLTTVLLLHGIVRALGGPASAGWWAGFWYVSAGLVAHICWQGKNDLIVTMQLVAAALGVAETANGRRRFALLTAVFCGLALGAKWTAAMTEVGLGAALLWGARGRLTLPRLAALVAVGELPAAGWWAQTWLFTGNPFHPFFSGVFHEVGWNPGYQAALQDWGARTRSVDIGIARQVLTGIRQLPGSHNFGSVAVMVLLPLGFALARGRAATALKGTVVAAYAAWLLSRSEGRYVFPVLPMVVALGAVAAAGIPARARSVKRGLAVATAALSLVMSGQFIGNGGAAFLAGQMDRPAFLQWRFTTWNTVRNWINDATPATSRFFFVGEQRRLWLERRTGSIDVVGVNPFWKMAQESSTPAEMRKRVRQMGLDYVVYNFVSAEFRTASWWMGDTWSPRSQVLYAEFCRQYEVPVLVPASVDYANGGFYVFRLTPRPVNQVWAWWLPGTEALLAPAHVAFDAGRREEGIRLLLALPPGIRASGGVQSLLGFFHDLAGHWSQGYPILHTVLERGLADSVNIGELGRAALALGRLDEAEGMMRKALAFYPDQQDGCRLNIGIVMIHRAKTLVMARHWTEVGLRCDEAERWWALMRPSSLAEYAIPLRLNRAILAGLRGLIATAAGRTAEAREDFQRAIALDPDPASSGYWANQLRAVTPQADGGVLR